jgi:hypothetical protein
MKKYFYYIAITCFIGNANAQGIRDMNKDWLLNSVNYKSEVVKSTDGKNIILTNGLVKRVFRITPNVACIDYQNLSNGQQLLRAIKPEAIVVIDGKSMNVGGFTGQKEMAYLRTEWIDAMQSDPDAFQYKTYSVSNITPFIKWKPTGWALNKKQATGQLISFVFESAQPVLKNIIVNVHYELYDGLPLIVKWVSVENKSNKPVIINKVVNEVLGMVEEESAVVGSVAQMEKQHGIYIETNYAFNNSMRYSISDQTIHWEKDTSYTSQVNYDYNTPAVLEVFTEKVTSVELLPDKIFNSVRTYELLMDSYDRERRGLAIRKMYSTVAPWTTENPIFMHLVSRNDEEVISAIDQCAATGYEALILSFGSHCNIENTSTENLERWKKLANYAHQKNIFIGGYSLFSSRKISDTDDVIDPVTGKPDAAAFFGNAPCFGSNWGLNYLATIKKFISYTGFDIFENDGPYVGDVCASTTHPGHKGLGDSQWEQIALQKDLYHWCKEQGVYVNAPDWYFLDGSNKIAIGYREVNFSLSREQQRILNRQNIYDGTWEKTPTMGWGFVPLTKYQGGGEDAVLEPLSEHLKDYEQLMMQYYGAGVQACYRGPRLYDTDETKNAVIKVINWYKKYRDILNSDIVHLRRAGGRDWDGILHVNPQLKIKGLMMLYNPLKEKISRKIKIPVYYTGLTENAVMRIQGAKSFIKKINRNYEIEIEVAIEPENYTWITIE